jgi:hypothetical protein
MGTIFPKENELRVDGFWRIFDEVLQGLKCAEVAALFSTSER